MKSIVRWIVAASMSFAAIALPPAVAQAPAKAAAKPAPPAAQRTFASPDDAVKGFVAALRAADVKALAEIIGPGSETWIRSGDAVQDAEDRQRFLAAHDEKSALQPKGDDGFILAIGSDAWPFAVPIVKKAGRWAFDAKAGREEVANRRVGRNELDTIKTLVGLVEAQRVYRAADPDGNGVADYARRIVSAKGKKDGLYWPATPAETASPLEALAALASAQGYATKASAAPQPFHGYLFRMLTDKAATSFTVVAYPVTYGVSGVMTFAVKQDGVVYEKDLGAATASKAVAISAINPDIAWKKAQP